MYFTIGWAVGVKWFDKDACVVLMYVLEKLVTQFNVAVCQHKDHKLFCVNARAGDASQG